MAIKIKQVQQLLVNLGKAIAVDGIWGVKSQAALDQALQETQKSSFDALVETTITQNEKIDDFWETIKYFKRSEFACKCPRCGGFPVEPVRELVEVADDLREHFNAAVTVTSGVRCEAHNKAVGGVAGSRHKLGKAMDFCVSGVSGTIVKVYCDKLIKTGKLRYCYIIGGNYVHMDVL